MARPIRLQLAGAHYLVTTRAASPDSLFTDEQDRQRFVSLIGRACQRYRWRCHAWCLGTDYYQLVIATERPNLAAGMRHLNSVHSQSSNRRRRVSGPMFEGRYTSQFVDPQRGLLAAVTDVLRGPLDRGLVTDLADWAWSSYAASVAPDSAPSWLAIDEVLKVFADDPAVAANALALTLRAAPAHGSDDGGARIYADAEFIARLVASARPDEEDDFAVLSRLRPPLREICEASADRRECMRLAYRSGYSQKEIARHFNVHVATVSRAVAAGTSWQRPSLSNLNPGLHAND